ncbi:MAG TPA: acyltransferase [Clostridiaceae bacterium]|nr:acyltransferase [Clostridiaceae bacterium]
MMSKQQQKYGRRRRSQTMKSDRIDSFTGLRGLAVIFVMLFHWFPGVVAGGYLGVVIFLVLSGYLVTSGLLTNYYKEDRIALWRYYKRRIRRLYPPLLFFFLIISTWILFLQRSLLNSYSANTSSVLFGYNNWWQISRSLSYFDQHGNFNVMTHMWTLSLELQIYLVWPLILWLMTRFGRRGLRRRTFNLTVVLTLVSFVLMVVLFARTGNITRIYYGTDTRLFSFTLGAALAVLFSQKKITRVTEVLSAKNVNRTALVLLMAMLLMMWFLPGSSVLTYYIGLLIFSVLTVCWMFVSADPRTFGAVVMGNRLFKWFGRRSYSFYIWQYAIMICAQEFMKYSKLDYNIKVLIQLPFVFLLTELSYQLTEVHWTLFWRRLTRAVPKRKRSRQRYFMIRIPIFILILTLITSFTLALLHPGNVAERSELEERIQADKPAMRIESRLGITGDFEALKAAIARSEGLAELQLGDQYDKTTEEIFVTAVQAFPELALTEEERAWLTTHPITCIGDSIVESAAEELRYRMPYIDIDSEVSRQFYDGLDILEHRKQAGTLHQQIIYALGTNAVLTPEMIEELAVTYNTYDIFFITTIQPLADVEKNINGMLTVGAETYGNVNLIDWYDFAKTHSELFYEDGTHPNFHGAAVYAQLIGKHVAERGVAREQMVSPATTTSETETEEDVE